MQTNKQHAAGRVSVMAPALRASGGPTRANRRRRLSLTTAASACWPASPASFSRGGSLAASCSSARGPPRSYAPTRF
uniref:SFRICE_031999 n=1 Tax=Spodoptera frugiperda TaxID=7108 RepID=A0A2H1VSI2_SPOFR